MRLRLTQALPHLTAHRFSRVLFSGLVFLGLVVLGRIAFMGWRADRLVHPPRQVSARTPSDVGISNWQNITFNATDGLTLRGWFVPSQNGTVVILVHGLSVDRSELLPEAALVTAHGYGALLFDLRNHGTSDGTVTTLGLAEVEDVRGAIAFVQPYARHIAILGHSMGASAAISAAAREPTVQAVIAVSAYATLDENIDQFVQIVTGLPVLPLVPPLVALAERAAGIHFTDVRPIEDVPRIAPRAILFIHGELDPLVLVNNSVRLYESACEPKRLYLIPNAAHNDVLRVNRAETEKQILGFLLESIH